MSVIDDNLHFSIDFKSIEKESYHDFEKKINTIQEGICKLLEDAFKTHSFVFSGAIKLSNVDELQILFDKNKHLEQEIAVKVGQVENLRSRYETDKKDQKLLSQEIKETHEAFLMAKKYYKKFLKMYYTIDEQSTVKQTIFVQFFTEAKKESEKYSLRLLHDTKTGQYELLSTTPKLNIQKELQRMLQETNDVPELLCCIRQAFLAMKTTKST